MASYTLTRFFLLYVLSRRSFAVTRLPILLRFGTLASLTMLPQRAVS